jgi:formate-dependent nitrite reductase membrane component NrfD
MPVIFLVSAMVSGIAALIVLYLFISWRQRRSPDEECLRALSRSLGMFLILSVSLEGLELLQMAYESGSEWHVLSTLLVEHLAVSYGLVQGLIGSVVPLLLLLTSLHPRLSFRLVAFSSGLASLLVLVQVFAMRWNVVVGGQLFSKSFRGFVEFPLDWTGREGLIAAAGVLTLPLLALWAAGKILPLWQEAET